MIPQSVRFGVLSLEKRGPQLLGRVYLHVSIHETIPVPFGVFAGIISDYHLFLACTPWTSSLSSLFASPPAFLLLRLIAPPERAHDGLTPAHVPRGREETEKEEEEEKKGGQAGDGSERGTGEKRQQVQNLRFLLPASSTCLALFASPMKCAREYAMCIMCHMSHVTRYWLCSTILRSPFHATHRV